MCETMVTTGHEESPDPSNAEMLDNSDCEFVDECDGDENGAGYAMMRPKKLDFNNSMELSDDGEPTAANGGQNRTPSPRITEPTDLQGIAASCTSPPCKRIRALRLFDSPSSPKTLKSLIENSALRTPIPNKGARHSRRPMAVPTAYHQHQLTRELKNGDDKPHANVNPFTPDGKLLSAKKRTRSKRSLIGSPSQLQIRKFDLADTDDSDDEMIEQPTKRVALSDANISRYHKEFLELELIGKGQFGLVYKCRHRVDGCNYAVKRSNKPVVGSRDEKSALNEVYAHAALGKHQHVVSYFSAWAEDDHMIIQNEYCNGGSLAGAIAKNCEASRHFTEAELRRLLLHVAKGLSYIHSMDLVHLDIKPGNIFISREKKQLRYNYESADDGYGEEEETEEITYKIGDLGHVTSRSNPQIADEGDCRYLSKEILENEARNDLTKADIFSLGVTMYEAAGGGPLPQNGPEWRDIRRGNLNFGRLSDKETKQLRYSEKFIDLLKEMIHKEPKTRPSPIELIEEKLHNSNGSKSLAQVQRELQAERMKNELLTKKLQQTTKCLQTIAPNVVELNSLTSVPPGTSDHHLRPAAAKTSSRAVGRKTNRSISTTNF